MNILTVAFLTQVMLTFGAPWTLSSGGGSSAGNSEDRVGLETIQKSLKLDSGSMILLDTQMGDVSIAGYDGNAIKVELTLEGTPESISRFHFTHDYFGNQLTLKAWSDKGKSTLDSRLKHVSFNILVPRDSSYSIRTSTQLGSISAIVPRNSGSVDLSAETGSVRLMLPCDLMASIDASTSGIGGILFSAADFASRLCFSTEVSSPDHLKGTMHGGGPAINAYAGAGNVHLEIVKDSSKTQS